MSTRLKTLLLVGLLAAFATFIGFFAGYFARATTTPTERYPLLAQAEGLIDQYFVHVPPDAPQLEYGAIQGMLAALNDKFSFFIQPQVARSESNVLAGHYGGIGVQIKRTDAGGFALYPFPDSPAAQAGVQNGDLLLTVNGTPVPNTAQPDAVDQLLRGEVKAGSTVTIMVQRLETGLTPVAALPATSATLEATSAVTVVATPIATLATTAPTSVVTQTFTIAFADINVPSVLSRVLSEDSTLGYIQIINFTDRTPDELHAALADLKAKGVKGLVLDLRNNPGGLLDKSVSAAGAFLDGGLVLIEQGRTQSMVYNAPTGQATDLPMVTLINGNTASAAELVGAALHDRGRTILIGQQTYGKGSVQLILDLSDKSSMHLTTAEWLTPNCTSLNGKGLTPDVPVTADPNGRDVELAEGISQLQQRIAKPPPPPTSPSAANCLSATPTLAATGSKG